MDEKSIEKFILDPKTGLQSTERIYQKLKSKNITREDIENVRSKLKTFQINTPIVVKESNFNTITASFPGDILQIDLMDVSKTSTKNNGIKFILTSIDVYSRYVIIFPIKNKSMTTVVNAMENILSKYKIKIHNITTDDGSEFNNSKFKSLMKTNNITHWITPANTPNKMAIIERFHRTLRNMLDLYFDHHNTLKYTNVIDDIMFNYNNSFHRTLKARPLDVFNKNDINHQIINVPEYDFKLGDTVRKSNKKSIFDKGGQTFSQTLYTIVSINPKSYIIKSIGNGQILRRTYMGYELKKVKNMDYNVPINNERIENQKLSTFKNKMKKDPAFNDPNTHSVDDLGNVTLPKHLNTISDKRIRKPNKKYNI